VQPDEAPDIDDNIEKLVTGLGHRPATAVEDGVANFVNGYRGYYNAD
jgi:UDP-glucuronate 4-epimerase